MCNSYLLTLKSNSDVYYVRITACLCVYYEGLNSEQNRASCDRPRFVLCGEKFQILNQTKYKVKAKRDLIRIAYTVVTAKISSGAATDVHAVVHGKHTQYTYIYISSIILVWSISCAGTALIGIISSITSRQKYWTCISSFSL